MSKRRPLWRRTWFWAAAFVVSIVGGWLLYGWERVYYLYAASGGSGPQAYSPGSGLQAYGGGSSPRTYSGGSGAQAYRIVEQVVPPVITAFATLTGSVASLTGIVLTYRMNRRQLELEIARLGLEMTKAEAQKPQVPGV